MPHNRLIQPIISLLHRSIHQSTLLFGASLLAVLVANSSLQPLYQELLNLPVLLQVGRLNLFSHGGQTMSLMAFTNDVLMVFFFLNVGLEIKREGLVGELSSIKTALLPVMGAIGGMILPVLCFYAICHTGDAAKGMAIPMATDIAFALAVLSVIKGVPTSLKTFLATLAVADDIGGIITIAIFYSHGFDWVMLLWAALVLSGLYILGRLGFRNLWLYYVGLVFVWLFFLQSGIHTTIAGVLVALVMPANPRIRTDEMAAALHSWLHLLPQRAQETAGQAVVLPHQQVAVVDAIRRIARGAVSPVQRMEAQLTPLVNYFILPLFAFVNAGVAFGNIPAEGLIGLPLAIGLGLIVGKPVGIFLFSLLYLKITRTPMPQGMTIHNLLALACLGGIGFTVSLFIASLSFGSPDHAVMLNEAKIGIFAGSILSGTLGYFWLKGVLRRERKHNQPQPIATL